MIFIIFRSFSYFKYVIKVCRNAEWTESCTQHSAKLFISHPFVVLKRISIIICFILLSLSPVFYCMVFVGVYVCLFVFKVSLQHAGKITQTEVPTQLKNTHQNFREQLNVPYYNISPQILFISLQYFTIFSQLLAPHFSPERKELLLVLIHFQFLISPFHAIKCSN